jgi:hypothetical protein
MVGCIGWLTLLSAVGRQNTCLSNGAPDVMPRPLLAALALLALVVTFSPAVAFAQDLPDAALPDASVGQGGAEQGSEENDMGGPCMDTRDCQGAFVCQAGRCVPTGVKKAGCGGTAALATMLLATGVVLSRRRRG